MIIKQAIGHLDIYHDHFCKLHRSHLSGMICVALGIEPAGFERGDSECIKAAYPDVVRIRCIVNGDTLSIESMLTEGDIITMFPRLKINNKELGIEKETN